LPQSVIKFRRIQPGEVHNKWTVVSKSEKPRHWLCRCECGNERHIFGPNLTQNKSKSCGCNWASWVPENKLDVAQASFNMIFGSYKKRAEEKHRNFSLTEEQFRDLIFQNCYYCESPPSNFRNYKRHKGIDYVFKYNGIDRIDSSLGYIENNCVPCCAKCNYMKQDLSIDDFLNQIKIIYKKHVEEI
jgi:hypothetical protein